MSAKDAGLLQDMFDQASDAFEHRVARHSVGIVFGEIGQHVDTATGIAVLWHAKHIIVTASHVFQGSSLDQAVTLILPRDRPLHRGNGVGAMPPLDLDCLLPIPRVSPVMGQSEDLAYFEIDESLTAASDLEFFELPLNAVAPPAGSSCLLSGFPSDLSGRISNEEVLVNLANRWSEIIDCGGDGRFLGGFDPNLHFLMEFRKADKGRQPEGFSGAGIWFPLRQSSDGPIWHAVPGLAGVQSSWFPRKSLTMATRVECLVRLLKENID
jgi:hypothetical protein